MAVRKQRLDKYYNLAKEKGYRARSAFKLLELNRKFNFLKDAKIAVDLCAAPGGWLQILAQEMPPVRKIIGVDLDPIKPLGGDTITFVGDITTVECRKTLISLLDGYEVDVFVHDGAPNFGTSKDRDVFIQNDLVFSSMKLASEFLRKGGVFVSKIFRSENFSRIIAILEELFGSVDVTKPLSSRSESAEVFAVCRNFKAPDYINPDFFDSGVVFKEDVQAEGDYLKLNLSEFILSSDSKILQRCLKIIPDFETDLITDDFREMFRDLKLVPFKSHKKILKLKEAIIARVRNGVLPVPALQSLKEIPTVCEEDECVEEPSKLERLEAELRKLPTEAAEEEKRELPSFSFFDDKIFGEFESTDGADLPSEEDEPDEVSVSSCSDSISMTESEIQCAIAMKEKGEEEFAEDTIDRHLIDSDDIRLPFEKRPAKRDEEKVERKKLEYLSRKRARAMRRAKKIMKDAVIEEEEEEAIVYKKVFKNLYKKEKAKPRLVFPGKGGRHPKIQRGAGKLKFLDRRMKHDLLIEKRRAKRNR